MKSTYTTEEKIPSIYTEEGRLQLLEDDAIDIEEAAFMEGYATAM